MPPAILIAQGLGQGFGLAQVIEDLAEFPERSTRYHDSAAMVGLRLSVSASSRHRGDWCYISGVAFSKGAFCTRREANHFGSGIHAICGIREIQEETIKVTLFAKAIVTVVAIVASCSRPTFSPTPVDVADRMLELAEVTGKDVVYDLGSGDGRIVIAAAKLYGARAVGIERSPALVKLAQAKAVEEGVASLVRFEVGDILRANIRPATVVTLFLSTEFNARLRPLLEQQLKPGTRIVSHDHPIKGWEPAVSPDHTEETDPGSGTVSPALLPSRPGKLVHMEVHSMQPRETQPDYLLSEDAPHWHTIYVWKID